MVILDLHEYTTMADNPEAKKEMFLSFWKQIGKQVQKTNSANVVLKLLNEPNQKLTAENGNTSCRQRLKIIRESNP